MSTSYFDNIFKPAGILVGIVTLTVTQDLITTSRKAMESVFRWIEGVLTISGFEVLFSIHLSGCRQVTMAARSNPRCWGLPPRAFVLFISRYATPPFSRFFRRGYLLHWQFHFIALLNKLLIASVYPGNRVWDEMHFSFSSSVTRFVVFIVFIFSSLFSPCVVTRGSTKEVSSADQL